MTLKKINDHVSEAVYTSCNFSFKTTKIGEELHKNRNYNNAYEIFKANSERNEPAASFWIAYYIEHGYEIIEVNKFKAYMLYKKAADL
ncbi:4072_t:CDS:1, partial [Dentiscutata heterogama]